MKLWKPNPAQAMSRLMAFWKRRMTDRILVDFSSGVPNQTWQRFLREHGFNGNPMAVAAEERPCLCESDPAAVLEICDAHMSVIRDLLDDSMPHALPTHHYSSGIVGGLLGGHVRFMGTSVQTWSTSQPMKCNSVNRTRGPHPSAPYCNRLHYTPMVATGSASMALWTPSIWPLSRAEPPKPTWKSMRILEA